MDTAMNAIYVVQPVLEKILGMYTRFYTTRIYPTTMGLTADT